MILITDNELSAMEGQPHTITVVYIYLRRFMDYATGIVGIKRGVSYQSISEALYIEPEKGVKYAKISKDAIRRILKRLERIGLLVRKGSADFLIFFMPLSVSYHAELCCCIKSKMDVL